MLINRKYLTQSTVRVDQSKIFNPIYSTCWSIENIYPNLQYVLINQKYLNSLVSGPGIGSNYELTLIAPAGVHKGHTFF